MIIKQIYERKKLERTREQIIDVGLICFGIVLLDGILIWLN